MTISTGRHVDLTFDQCPKQIGDKAEVSPATVHIWEQNGCLTDIGVLNLVEIDTEIGVQDVGQLTLKQTVHLMLHVETLTEAVSVDGFEGLAEESEFQLQLLELLCSVLTLQVCLLGEQSLRQQFDETVTCRLCHHLLFVDGEQVAVIVTEKCSLILGSPLVEHLRIEIVQQQFCTDFGYTILYHSSRLISK